MSAENNNHGNKDRQTNDHLYIEEHVQHDHRLHTFYTVLELNVGAVAMKNVFLLLAAMGSTCTCHYAASVILSEPKGSNVIRKLPLFHQTRSSC